MSNRNASITEHCDRSKLDWLRSAARDSFDAIDRREGFEFHSMDELADYIHRIGEKLISEHRRG